MSNTTAPAGKTAAADPANPLAQLTKMIEQFKIPGVDMSAIVESRRKDIDALIETNKATLDTTQLLVRKQAEILTHALQSIQDGAQAAGKAGAGPQDPHKQAELARKAYEKAVTEMGELAEIVRKAQADAMASITARAQQSAEEMKSLVRTR